MRIIGGLYRGKKIFSPLSEKVRPTSDRARESVFNILTSKLLKPWSQINLADIFAGTGAFAFEALSRGAQSVTLIDIDISSATKNAALFSSEKNKIEIIKADATCLFSAPRTFDIIFLDAPYHKGLNEQAITAILQKKWLSDDGICIVETAADETLHFPTELNLIDKRRYGVAQFWFLALKTSTQI